MADRIKFDKIRTNQKNLTNEPIPGHSAEPRRDALGEVSHKVGAVGQVDVDDLAARGDAAPGLLDGGRGSEVVRRVLDAAPDAEGAPQHGAHRDQDDGRRQRWNGALKVFGADRLQ